MICGLRPFATLGVDWALDGTTIRPAPADSPVWVEQMYGVELDELDLRDSRADRQWSA
jgi:hypothetical protein